MIDRAYGKIELICDDCCNPMAGKAVFSPDEFHDMIKEAKIQSWDIVKEGREWIHICPDCQ